MEQSKFFASSHRPKNEPDVLNNTLVVQTFISKIISEQFNNYCILVDSYSKVKDLNKLFIEQYETVPDWLKPKIKKKLITRIEFSNYNKMYFIHNPRIAKCLTFSQCIYLGDIENYNADYIFLVNQASLRNN